MSNKRREFIKLAGLTGLGAAAGNLLAWGGERNNTNSETINFLNSTDTLNTSDPNETDTSIIGLYGAWASSLTGKKIPAFSYRKNGWNDLQSWQKQARQKLTERLGIPDIGAMPAVKVHKQYSFDNLHIEELSWQLPYGRPTEAILLKPLNGKGRLPAILAFHDHGGNKYFGCRKITKTSDNQHPLMKEHQHDYYGNFAWANEIAKRGYVVLVADAFALASRRVMMKDVPVHLRTNLNDEDPENPKNIKAYNTWAAEH
jgi:hypothetical protein